LQTNAHFLVKNTKEFKKKILNDRKFFDPAIHRVITADIEQIYSNVNFVRCVYFILERIYTKPRKYFNFKEVYLSDQIKALKAFKILQIDTG
jgi:hypothetical protein